MARPAGRASLLEHGGLCVLGVQREEWVLQEAVRPDHSQVDLHSLCSGGDTGAAQGGRENEFQGCGIDFGRADKAAEGVGATGRGKHSDQPPTTALRAAVAVADGEQVPVDPDGPGALHTHADAEVVPFRDPGDPHGVAGPAGAVLHRRSGVHPAVPVLL